MKHAQVIKLRNDLSMIKGLKSHEVNYAIAENLERLEVVIKPLVAQEKDLEKIIKDFSEDRKKIGEKYATVDGEVKTKKEVTPTGGIVELFDIPEASLSAWKKETSELRVKYAEDLKKYEEARDEYLKFLDEGDSPFTPFMVKNVHVPEDITTENMKAIFPILRKKATDE